MRFELCMELKMPRKAQPKQSRAVSPEARMQQLTARAYDLAEKQLIEGNISPSTLNVLLKAGTIEQELMLENLRTRNKLNESKVDLIDTDVKGKGDSEEVINAIRGYKGSVDLGD